MILSRCCLKYLPLFLILYPICKIRGIIVFEHLLQASVISFKDFPQDYASALIEEQPDNEPKGYTWGPIDTIRRQTIPPIIHFIWFEGLYHDHLDVSRIPVEVSHAPGRCREFNPDFKVQIWNESAAHQLLADHYAWFLDVYDNYAYPIQRVDAFKYFILWHEGGIYMDLDVACRRALNPLLEFPAWYPKASPLGIDNDLIATRARHPLTGLMLTQ